jgi:hypothetical protein
MIENQASIDLIERLASVDSKLEKLIGSQPVIKDGGPAKILEQPDIGYSKKILPDPFRRYYGPENFRFLGTFEKSTAIQSRRLGAGNGQHFSKGRYH